jgi:hypothetical protein
MRKIRASQAKVHPPELLNHETSRRLKDITSAIQSILDLRERTAKMTFDELRQARDEGRKY